MIFFALHAASRVLAHLLRATAKRNVRTVASATDALAAARLAVAAQCAAHRAHLLALIARTDDSLFGNVRRAQKPRSCRN